MQQQQMMNSGAMGAGSSESALVYMPVPIRSTTYGQYKHKQSMGLGVTLIIIGILCIIFNSVCIGLSAADYDYYNSFWSYIGHGIWCGAMFLITGGLGVGAGAKKTKCLIVSFMVMCILSATITISLLTIAIIGACLADECHYYYGYGYGYPYYYPPCEKMSSYEVIVAMEAMMAILGFIAGVICIWGSAICCCSGVCCCNSHPTPVIAQQPAGYYPNGGPIVYFSQSQTGQNVYQPQPTTTYSHGMIAPQYVANYSQPGWAMQPPINTINPYNGQAPPQYPATVHISGQMKY